MISRRAIFVAPLLLLSGAFAAKGEPLHGRYFVVVWGYEGKGNLSEDSHTFATFYRGDDLAANKAHPATISWLPATGVVRPFGVERGKNFSLGETLALAARHRYRVATFGPYEIGAKTYANAVARIQLLNSGKVAYTMINGPEGAMNCIAASSVDGLNVALSWGFAASQALASQLASNHDQVDREASARLHPVRYTR